MRQLPWVVLCAILVSSLKSRADIYQMTDSNGVTHYTNIRPNGRGWKRVFKSRILASGSQRRGQNSSSLRNDPSRYTRYDSYIEEAALLYQLPRSFVRAILRVESNFYPDVVSSAGAMGLMQLMPVTAARMGVRNPFDPRESILGGTRYLRILANAYNGDLLLTIAAYNAGQGAVAKYNGVPPYPETRRYIQNVLQYYYLFRTASSTAND